MVRFIVAVKRPNDFEGSVDNVPKLRNNTKKKNRPVFAQPQHKDWKK